FMLLGPDADPAGSFINAANAPVSLIFNPADHPPGDHVFRHVVQGDAPCVNDTAKVTITVHRRPVAGISTAPVLCASGPIVPLLGLLGGTPDNNGSWAFHPPSGDPVPHGPTFDPATDLAGAYVYTVSAFAPCANSTATVQITLAPAPDAGLFGSRSEEHTSELQS